MENIKGIISERIDLLIRERGGGKTQKEIAKEIGISPQSLTDYKRAHREAEVFPLLQIADYFGVSLDYLVGKEECTTPDNQKIHERLGLSDEAITFLENDPLMGMTHSPGIAGTLNELLTTFPGRHLLRTLCTYFFVDFSKSYTLEDKTGEPYLIWDGDTVAHAFLWSVPSNLKEIRDGVIIQKRAEKESEV